MTLDREPCKPGYADTYGDRMFTVAHDGTQFIGVGTNRASIFDQPQGAIFTSTTGATWTSRTIPFNESQVNSDKIHLAPRGRTVALVGPGVAGTTSNGGVTWQVGTPPAESAVVVDAVAGTSRWVAAGFTAAGGSAATWVSTNGRTWSRRTSPAFSGFCPEAVASRGNRFVIVGSDCRANPRAIVVTSSDGLTWARNRLPVSRPIVLRDVAAIGSGFLAGGSDVSASGAKGSGLWYSASGTSWRRVGFFSAPSDGEEVVRIVRTSAGVHVLLERGGLTDGQAPTAYWSPTGTSGWRRDGNLPNPGYGSEDGDLLVDAAASGTRIVAVGWFNDIDPGYHSSGGVAWRGTAR